MATLSLEVALADGILELTLARPQALNAFTLELHTQLAAALARAREPDVRAVILTGAGRAFCAGQDLAEAQGGTTPPAQRLREHYNPNLRTLRALELPVVAAVNGVAAGAGVGLALACDVRVVSTAARFLPAFATLGLVPDAGVSWFASELLGYARAYEWLTSNRAIEAEEALALGFAHELTAPDELLARARARARELAQLPGEAAGLTKRLLAQAQAGALAAQLELEAHLQQQASAHPAYAARRAAFLARRSG
jgi:2-(1,2-epoxy-1,2-dihydrophenyl)acetyl-CoA isomerase